MRRGIVIVLVVIVLLTGLPVLVSMAGMDACPECGLGILLAVSCLVALAATAVVMAVPTLAGHLRMVDLRLRPSLFTRLLERPPQLV